MKGELEELGEETEGVENISKMQGQILNMTNGAVNIFDDAGNFKSTYEIMNGIADVYDRLSDTDRADLLETISGKNHANTVAALIQNWETAEKMNETAMNAEGSAAAENEKYLDSLQGRLNSLTTSVQAFSNIALDSGFLKGLVSGATEVIEIFSTLIDNVGVLPTLLGAAGAGFSVFGKGAFSVDSANGKIKLLGQNLGDIANLLGSVLPTNSRKFSSEFTNLFSGTNKGMFDDFKKQMDIDKNAFEKYTNLGDNASQFNIQNALSGASESLKKYIQDTDAASQSWADFSVKQKGTEVAVRASSKSLKSTSGIIKEYNNGCKTVGMSQKEFVDAVSSTNPVMGQYLSSVSSGTASFGGYARALIGATAKTVALTAASTALNAVLTMGIGVAIGLAVAGISKLITYYDDLAESVDASSTAFETANSELMNNKTAFDSAAKSYDKLRDGVNKLTGENVSLSTEEYQEYQNAVNTIADSVPEMISGFDSQGNAILNTAANVDTLTAAYNNLIAAEAKAFVKGDEDKGYVGLDKTAEDFAHDVEKYHSKKYLNGQTSDSSAYDIEANRQLEELLKSTDIEQAFKDYESEDAYGATAIRKKLQEITDEEIKAGEDAGKRVAEVIKANKNEISSAVQEYNSEYNSLAAEMNQQAEAILNSMLYSDESDISKLNEQTKSLISQLVSNFDGEFYDQLVADNGGDWNKVDEYLQTYMNNLAKSFSKIDTNQQQIIEDAFDMQYDFDAGNISMDEFAAKAKEMDGVLRDIGLDEDSRKEIMLSLGFEYDEDGKLEKWTADYESALNRIQKETGLTEVDVDNWLGGLSGSELAMVMDLDLTGVDTIDELQHALDLAKALNGVGQIDISVESDNIEKLNTALEESASATGLNSESIDTLSNMYADLDSFDPAELFERTANGIHLNAEALRKYQSEYENTNKEKIQDDLKTLQDEYSRLTQEMAEASSPAETAMLEAQRDNIRDEINSVSNLAAQYEGLTSSYNKWLQAKAGAEQGDMYDAMYGGIESTEELYNQGLVGTNEFREYVQMMTDEDLSNATTETIMGVYEKGMPLMKRYFTEGADGVQNFLNDVQNLNSEWAHMTEDGNWEFNFGEGNDEEIAKALGLSTEQVQAMIRKLNDYGFEVDIDSEFTGLEDLQTQAEKAQETLQDLAAEGKIDFNGSFNFNTENIDYLDEQIQDAMGLLEQFRNEDGTIDVSAPGASEVQGILATLLAQKASLTQPDIMKVTVEDPSSEVGQAVAAIQTLYSATTERDINLTIGADASGAEQTIGSIAGQLSALQQENPELYAQLGLDTSEFNNALATINQNVSVGAQLDPSAVSTIQTSLSGISADILAKVTGIDTSMVDAYTATETTKPGTVNWDNNTAAVDSYAATTKTAVGTVNWGNNTTNVRTTFSATGTVTWTNASPVNGTAHVNGSAFADGSKKKQFKQGDWGLKGSGTALVGELGQEIVVRDGHFFTVGDNGAEFFNYKPGDIVFNHKQSEELFKNGYVTSNGGRGRAYVEGTAFSSGSGGFWGGASSGSSSSGTTVVNNTTNNYNYGSSTKSSSSSKSSGSSSSKAKKEADEFKESLDLIEIMIDRIERAIDSLDRTASSSFRSFSDRNNALTQQMQKVREEMSLQQQAYERYLQQAYNSGLSNDWANRIINGEINVELITDENLKDQIDDFQEWYEKALDAKDSFEDLNETLGELSSQRFENIQEQFEGILDSLGYEQSMVENYVDRAEVDGQFVSKNFYRFLQDNVHAQAEALREEVKQLIQARDDAVNAGTVAIGSAEWNEMNKDINDVTVSIHELGTQWAEYAKAMRETEWDIFDTIQDRISGIADEAQFLIDLMSNKKLFEDNGQLTNEGMASIGLYGEQYNILMNQADRYAEEIKKLEEQMAKEPFGPDAYGNASNAFNQDIIDRYYELIEAQQEAILSAEDMKNAIKDMVEEGIDLEIQHLDDLIDKYLEALQAQKDLYDYSSEIEDKTQDIASIEKQLSAYANDTSEETKAIVQQLTQDLEDAQKDLADAEYERQISDIERLLDQFKNDYAEILNMRLDNIDFLMQQMIDYINANSVQIGETINNAATDVGYTISDETQKIWDTANGTQDVLKMYGEGFLQNGTTIANTLEKVNTNILTMVSKLDSIAQQKIQYAQQQNAANTPVKTPPPSPAPSPAPSRPQNNGGGDGVARVGDRVKFVSGRYYNDSYGSGPTGSHGQGGYVYITSINNGAPYPYHISSGSRIGSGDLGWLRLDQLAEYATGKRKLDDDEYAWTQEKGPEMIVRPSDGAILTPLAKNDSVLTADATRNIWNMANDPAKFVKDNLGIGDGSMSPVATGGTTNYTQNLESVVFNLPNVKNYEQLLSSMQKDKNFERLISSMTIDKIAGKNAGMKKSKAIR